MATVTRLDEAEVLERLGERALEGWELRDGKLHRAFQFADFVQAFGFMSSMALHSEAVAHHPEWFNVWNQVRVDLTTHDAGGISEKDFAWAEKANQVAAR